MAQTTIEQFATELKMPAGALIEQLAAAGVGGKKQGDGLSGPVVARSPRGRKSGPAVPPRKSAGVIMAESVT